MPEEGSYFDDLTFEHMMMRIASLIGEEPKRCALDGFAEADIWKSMRDDLSKLEEKLNKEYDDGSLYKVLLALVKALDVLADKLGGTFEG